MIGRRSLLKTSLLGAGSFFLGPCLYGGEKPTGHTGFPKRFVFIRKSNGLQPNDLSLPTAPDALKQQDSKKEAFEVALDKYELPNFLKELEGDKEHLTILHGLSTKMSENGHYVFQSVMGCFNSKGGSISALKRATIDFELAKLFPSPVGHVELSFSEDRRGIVSGLSVPSPYQKNFCYGDPITAFNELFKCVLNPSSMNADNDMLAYLNTKEALKANVVEGFDKRNFENHAESIEAIRSRNAKLMKLSAAIAKKMPDSQLIYENGAQSATTPQKQEAMTEVLISALISGMTNVVTYTIDTLGTSITGIPGYEDKVVNIHGVGHGGNYGGPPGDLREKMEAGHIHQMKKIMDRLKAEPEGNGTMFDNTMIMYFPEGGEKHHGTGVEAPFVILSGKNCRLDIAGRFIRLPYWATEGHQTLGNWYTTLLNAHGNPIKHYGDLDATMSRKKLPQEGSIKRFIRA